MQNFFLSQFSKVISFYIFQATETQGRDRGNYVPSTVGEDQVWDHWMNLRLDGMHPSVLSESADVVAKRLVKG